MYLHAGSPDPLVNAKVRVPILTTTGTADADVKPAATRRSWAEQMQSHPRVFANLQGAVHNESAVRGRLNRFIAAFFRCHVGDGHVGVGDGPQDGPRRGGDDDACDAVYGSGAQALCQAFDYSECDIVK